MDVLTPDAVGSVFAAALIEVVSRSLGLSLAVISGEKDSGLGEITGAMSLIGNRGGVVFISAKESDMKTVYSCMLGVPSDEAAEEDIHDAMCEIVNMTAGSAKAMLGGTDFAFSLSQPFIICGDNMSVICKKRSSVFSTALTDGEITIKIKIIF